MNNIYSLHPDDLPSETVKCLGILHGRAKRGKVTGIAFVAYIDGYGFIANSAGDAYENAALTLGMLNALRRKLELRLDGGKL